MMTFRKPQASERKVEAADLNAPLVAVGHIVGIVKEGAGLGPNAPTGGIMILRIATENAQKERVLAKVKDEVGMRSVATIPPQNLQSRPLGNGLASPCLV